MIEVFTGGDSSGTVRLLIVIGQREGVGIRLALDVDNKDTFIGIAAAAVLIDDPDIGRRAFGIAFDDQACL